MVVVFRQNSTYCCFLQSATTRIRMTVTDVNDNSPVFGNPAPRFSVRENQNNAVVGRVEARDADTGNNAQIKFSLPPQTT